MEGEVKPLVEVTPTPEDLSLDTVSLQLALGGTALADEGHMAADGAVKHLSQPTEFEPVAATEHVTIQFEDAA